MTMTVYHLVHVMTMTVYHLDLLVHVMTVRQSFGPLVHVMTVRLSFGPCYGCDSLSFVPCYGYDSLSSGPCYDFIHLSCVPCCDWSVVNSVESTIARNPGDPRHPSQLGPKAYMVLDVQTHMVSYTFVHGP